MIGGIIMLGVYKGNSTNECHDPRHIQGRGSHSSAPGDDAQATGWEGPPAYSRDALPNFVDRLG